MKRNNKVFKPKRYRIRRNSYLKKVYEDAKPWYTALGFDDSATPRTSDFIVTKYLKEIYKIIKTSSSMRRVNGYKINKEGSWSIRIDYVMVHDPKLFLIFNLKYSPVLIDNDWFVKKD